MRVRIKAGRIAVTVSFLAETMFACHTSSLFTCHHARCLCPGETGKGRDAATQRAERRREGASWASLPLLQSLRQTRALTHAHTHTSRDTHTPSPSAPVTSSPDPSCCCCLCCLCCCWWCWHPERETILPPSPPSLCLSLFASLSHPLSLPPSLSFLFPLLSVSVCSLFLPSHTPALVRTQIRRALL